MAKAISSIESTNTHRKDNLIQAHLYFAIYDLALRVKNHHFQEEKEWRLIYSFDKTDKRDFR
jgi:hypothetical protein